MHAFSNTSFMQDWMHKPYRVKHNKEWKRLVTNGFIHADWMHLLLNMMTLYFFGKTDALQFFFYELTGDINAGTMVFFVFYFAAIIASCIPSQLKHKSNSWYAALGASGAVSAVMLAVVFLDPLCGIPIFPFSLIFPKGIPGFLFAGIYIWYSNYMNTKQYDNVAHDAHYAGALFGLVFVAALKPSSILDFYEAIVVYVQNIF
jgi:membrane associated rhomboid family serine protease